MSKKICINCLFLIVVFLCTNICYAKANKITEENLSEVLQEVISSEAVEGDYSISVSNNAINVIEDNESYNLNYYLTDKPTFSLEIPIQKGMSYDDFKKKTDNLMLPMLGYIAVANIQGVDIEDATTYFGYSVLKGSLGKDFLTKNSYTIVNDLNVSEGVKIENKDDPKKIYASEFGNRVMEYVNSIYKEKQHISDSTEINSYSLTIEKIDTTDTSCKLKSTLSVNLDADFSKLIGYTGQIANSFMNKNITKENADIVLSLKIGQKCKIVGKEKITGYQFSGYGCIELNDDKTEITATSTGIQNGYLYIGNKQKSIYVTVQKNTENIALDTITLDIDSTAKKEIVENKNSNKGDSQNQVNSVLDFNTLPRTGKEVNWILIVLYIIVATCTIGLVTILFIKRK